jgi:hypothetical protein
VLCMKTIFQMPACFWRKADSSHFWLTVPALQLAKRRFLSIALHVMERLPKVTGLPLSYLGRPRRIGVSLVK